MVMVADTMLSYQDVVPATDNATEKIFLLESGWFALFAGNTSPLNSLLYRMRENLRADSAATLNEAEELDRLKRACKQAYQAERSQQLTDRHLSVYGIKTQDEFKREGYHYFGPQVFAEVSREVRDFCLDTTLLICGFDAKNFPHIFEIADPGELTDHDQPGCAAIGAGAQMAMGVLSPRSNKRLSWKELVYRLCEAKFTSETANGVGRSTSIAVMFLNGVLEILRPVHIEQLRHIWEEQRATPIPAEALDIIDNGIHRPHDPVIN